MRFNIVDTTNKNALEVTHDHGLAEKEEKEENSPVTFKSNIKF